MATSIEVAGLEYATATVRSFRSRIVLTRGVAMSSVQPVWTPARNTTGRPLSISSMNGTPNHWVKSIAPDASRS
jgi:hypothetical protein